MGRAWCSACVVVACQLALGCAPHRTRDGDAGVHGPEGGVLTFDAAMLVRVDAAPPPGRDAGRDAHVVGSDAGHRCAGSAYSCSLVGATNCMLQLGCTSSGNCSGISTSCYSLFDSFSCGSQQGCYWSSSSRNCSGSAWPCDLESGSASCASQRGCYWERTCTGSAQPCSLLGEFECTGQLGCYWE